MKTASPSLKLGTTIGIVCCGLLAASSSGCARSAKGPATPTGPAVAEAEPIHDTIQEFRRGERIACAAGTDLVYVVARDGGLHSFDPSALRFNRIGTLDCPGAQRSRPHSMAVDRSGQAWVGYDNGVVAHASITTAECTASQINVRAARIGRTFGMGFAPTPEGGIGGETLFLTSEPAWFQDFNEGDNVPAPQNFRRGSLARIDDGTHIKIAGEFPPSLRGMRGELSSRSDGRLFAFFTGDPFQLAEIDPATADVRWQKTLEGMRFSETGTGSWAFAAVGSEFYFFWADRSGPSKVTRLKEDGSLEHVINNAGMEIVGAGASTCATKRSVGASATNQDDPNATPSPPANPAPTPTPPPVVVTPAPPIVKSPSSPPPTTKPPPPTKTPPAAPVGKSPIPGLPPLPPPTTKPSAAPRRASPPVIRSPQIEKIPQQPPTITPQKKRPPKITFDRF